MPPCGVPVMMHFHFSWDFSARMGERREKKKPGFTERIMTVMFSKSFHSIALLDNHFRGSGLFGAGLPRRLVTLEDRCTFDFSQRVPGVLFSLHSICELLH